MGASELAVDVGGPTLKFLRLSVKDMYCTSGMFGGLDKQLGLVPNSEGNNIAAVVKEIIHSTHP